VTEPESISIDELLADWKLVKNSKGDPGKHEACGASLLSIKAGEKFTDRLECAHPTLNSLMISAFDSSHATPADLEALVRAGEHGMVETRWIADTIVLCAHGRTDAGPGPDPRNVVQVALDVFAAIEYWKAAPRWVPLVGANLVGASLVGASLVGASLVGANLVGANLVGANLDGANLVGANLVGANLDGARYLEHAYGLTSAYGSRHTRLPKGWHVDQSTGLICRDAEVA